MNEHLKVKTRPIARSENILHLGVYRVTVLGDRLFRVEKNAKRIFRDSATQAVWFRDMEKQRFSCSEEEKEWVVATSACKLIISKEGGQVCVELNGKRIFADNEGNLLGTYRTLDNCDGALYKPWRANEAPYEISLGMGVCSQTGVARLEDGESLSVNEEGEVLNERAEGEDSYIFAFGKDYRGAVRALFSITGAPPILPRFALGNWWSRYHIYTDREYLSLLAQFAEREIPLAVATVDMDWHYSTKIDEEVGIAKEGKNSAEYIGTPWVNLGWTGYAWNKNLFPDPKGFLQKVKAMGLKITLNLHPSDGARYWDEGYAPLATAMGIDPKSGRQVPFAFTDYRFINGYFEHLHRPHEKNGVDFWWIDWQQPNIPWHTGEGEYDPLWALNHYHYLDNADGHSVPLVLSRYGGVGSHRYPVGFSGDTFITWETLDYLPYFTATASNIGYTWWSHDIGGHQLGSKSDELFARHIQYGVFSPINRLHCTDAETMTKEPWAYKNGAGLIAERFLRLRHELLPYLYTAAWATHKEGRALVEPLYYEYDCAPAYRYKKEYLFGSELLVAPVTTPMEADGYARTSVWLPEGTWTDIFTGDRYEVGKNGSEKLLYRTLDELPVLIKAGGILPLSKDKGNGCKNPTKMELWAYEGEGEYTLYEDGAEEEKQGTFTTRFVAKNTQTAGVRTQSLTIYPVGEEGIVPKDRTILVRFKDIENARLCLYENGERRETDEVFADCPALRISPENGVEYRIEARYAPPTAYERFMRRAKKVLIEAEGENEVKRALYREICEAGDIENALQKIDESGVPAIAKLRLKENL